MKEKTMQLESIIIGKFPLLVWLTPRFDHLDQSLIFHHVPTLETIYQMSTSNLTPKSNWHLISPYNITTESHIHVMRVKEMIPN